MSQNIQEPVHPIEEPRDDGATGGGGVDLLCAKCGAINPALARFCAKCGQPLESLGQENALQFQQGSSSSPEDNTASLYTEAGTAIFLSSPVTEEAFPIKGNQAAIDSVSPANSPGTGGAIPINGNGPGTINSGNWGRRITSRRFIVITLLALILLLIAGSLPFLLPYLHTILPANTANVTITPASKNFNNTYQILV
jgi:hypothetical protein